MVVMLCEGRLWTNGDRCQAAALVCRAASRVYHKLSRQRLTVSDTSWQAMLLSISTAANQKQRFHAESQS